MTNNIAEPYTFTMQRDVAAFHDAFEMPNRCGAPGPLPLDRIELRIGLIVEEGVTELRRAADRGDLVEIIDALIDTIYVALGALVEMGQDSGDIPDHILGEHLSRPLVFDATALINAASETSVVNEMWLGMLERAFAAQDTEWSSSILQVIATHAMLALISSGVDPRPFFAEVQRANMSKLGADGLPVKSRGLKVDGYPAGKVLKGPSYIAPDLSSIFASLYGDPALLGVHPEFVRGVKAGTAALRLYFVNEDDLPVYGTSSTELDEFTAGAASDAIGEEHRRVTKSNR